MEAPLKAALGRPCQLADITLICREILEEQLEELHHSLSELRPPGPADGRLASIVATDRIHRRGNYLYIDPQAEDILGFSPSYYYEGEGAIDALEVGWTNILHAQDCPRIHTLWWRVLGGQPCPSVEYRTEAADGHYVWLADSLRPILADHLGQALVIEGRWRDITPRKRRETEFLIKQLELALRQLKSAPRPGFGVLVRFPRRPEVGRSRKG